MTDLTPEAVIEAAIRYGGPIYDTPDPVEVLRDILKALREPSATMIAAGADAPFSRIDHQDAEHLWQAMVDAALLETI